MIDRRTFLRSTAGVAAFGAPASLALASVKTPTISANLVAMIETHREAYAAVTDYSDTVSAAERAFFQARDDDDARQAKEEAHSVQDALLTVEKTAFLALPAYPVETLDELRAVITVGKATWWEHDDISDEEGSALIAGIMGEART